MSDDEEHSESELSKNFRTTAIWQKQITNDLPRENVTKETVKKTSKLSRRKSKKVKAQQGKQSDMKTFQRYLSSNCDENKDYFRSKDALVQLICAVGNDEWRGKSAH